jgi:hypothetical protein
MSAPKPRPHGMSASAAFGIVLACAALVCALFAALPDS